MTQISANQYQQLEAIIKEGNSVIEVIIEGYSRFYTFTSFEPSFKGSSTSVPYCQFRGVEISSFIEVVRQPVSHRSYIQSFTDYIEKKEALTFKFNEIIPYFIYS